MLSRLGAGRIVTAMAFAPDGQTLVEADEKNLWIWDIQTGQERCSFTTTDSQKRELAFSPDGQCLAWEGYSSTFFIWDVAGGKERCQLNNPEPTSSSTFVFAPDSKTLARCFVREKKIQALDFYK